MTPRNDLIEAIKLLEEEAPSTALTNLLAKARTAEPCPRAQFLGLVDQYELLRGAAVSTAPEKMWVAPPKGAISTARSGGCPEDPVVSEAPRSMVPFGSSPDYAAWETVADKVTGSKSLDNAVSSWFLQAGTDRFKTDREVVLLAHAQKQKALAPPAPAVAPDADTGEGPVTVSASASVRMSKPVAFVLSAVAGLGMAFAIPWAFRKIWSKE